MDKEQRQKTLDAIQHLNDYSYRAEISQSVREEVARIKALRRRKGTR